MLNDIIFLCIPQISSSDAVPGRLTAVHYERGSGIAVIRRTLINLSRKSEKLPSQLYIADVTDLSKFPKARGGFADIHMGRHQGQAVAVKCLLLSDQTPEVTVATRKVLIHLYAFQAMITEFTFSAFARRQLSGVSYAIRTYYVSQVYGRMLKRRHLFHS
jgi:hypothetical protein